jgi:hypothetical protein
LSCQRKIENLGHIGLLRERFHLLTVDELKALPFPTGHVLPAVVVFPEKQKLPLFDCEANQRTQVVTPIASFLFHLARGALARCFIPFEMTAGKNPKPGVGGSRNIISMLKKRCAIVTQQHYSHDLAIACFRRGNHKRSGIIPSSRGCVNRASGSFGSVQRMTHELR